MFSLIVILLDCMQKGSGIIKLFELWRPSNLLIIFFIGLKMRKYIKSRTFVLSFVSLYLYLAMFFNLFINIKIFRGFMLKINFMHWLVSVLNHLLNHQNTQLNSETMKFKLQTSYLKSLGSSLQSHPLWVALYKKVKA